MDEPVRNHLYETARDDPAGAVTGRRYLDDLVEAVVIAVPGASCGGISIVSGATCVKPATIVSTGATHPSLAELDRLQLRWDEGPLVEQTRRKGADVSVVDLDEAVEARWPNWTPRARTLGAGSVLTVTVPCGTGRRTTTVTTLLGDRPGAFTSASAERATSVAAPVAVALAARRKCDGLERAVSSRDVIGQAKGVLVERFRIDADEAFDRLVRASQETNTKLVDVATWFMEHEARRPTGDPVPALRARACRAVGEPGRDGPTTKVFPLPGA